MWTLTGGVTRGRPRVLDRWQRALIILVEGEWMEGLDCEIKGLDSMIGATGCEDCQGRAERERSYSGMKGI